MAYQHAPVVLRIRTRTNDPNAPRWIIGGPRYNVDKAHACAAQLRREGHVVHVDQADWYR